MHNLWVFYYFFSKITFYLRLFSDCCDQFGYRGPLYTCLVWSVRQVNRYFRSKFPVSSALDLSLYICPKSKSLRNINLSYIIIVMFNHPRPHLVPIPSLDHTCIDELLHRANELLEMLQAASQLKKLKCYDESVFLGKPKAKRSV